MSNVSFLACVLRQFTFTVVGQCWHCLARELLRWVWYNGLVSVTWTTEMSFPGRTDRSALLRQQILLCFLPLGYNNGSLEFTSCTRSLTTLCTGHFDFYDQFVLPFALHLWQQIIWDLHRHTMAYHSLYWPFHFPTIGSINCHPPYELSILAISISYNQFN